MTFTPPQDAKQSAVRPAEGWLSCGWLALDAWKAENGETYKTLSEKLGCSPGQLTAWKQGRTVQVVYLQRIESLTTIPREAFTWWVATLDEEPPSPSLKRDVEEPPADEPLGTTPEELRSVARRLKTLARRPGLTPGQQATLEGKLSTVLCRLDERAKALETHPDFDDHVEDVLTALEKTLEQYGVTPDGARTVFAGHLEVLEAKRARRAA